MTGLKKALKEANAGGLAVFKPGYPTARGQYMVLDKGKDRALAALAARGYLATRLPCGHDYNYGGDLYSVRPEGTRRNPARRAKQGARRFQNDSEEKKTCSNFS